MATVCPMSLLRTRVAAARSDLLHRAAFHSPSRQRTSTDSQHFDTHHLVSLLTKDAGLTQKQAVGVMSALEEVIQGSVRGMVSNLVTRAEQEKVRSFVDRVCGCADWVSVEAIYSKG